MKEWGVRVRRDGGVRWRRDGLGWKEMEVERNGEGEERDGEGWRGSREG